MDTSTDQLRIARHLLLSSPPGQFELILRDLQDILSSSLTPKWVEEIRTEYNSRTGREALLEPDQEKDKITDIGLDEGMKNYIAEYYASQGVKSNYRITAGENGAEFSILLYAERIQLEHFHAGSWTARYSIKTCGDAMAISGKISLHAHTFENGNLQIKSMVNLPEVQTKKDGIFKQIKKWDEESVMTLRGVYDDMSGDILKKLRRVMPVTRTRFDWNVEGHRGIRELGVEVVQNRE